MSLQDIELEEVSDADIEVAEAEEAGEELLKQLDRMVESKGLPAVIVAPPVKEEVKPQEVKETSWEADEDHAKFLIYLHKKLKEIPAHSGQTTVGCEKAVSYLRRLDKEISKAIQSDESGIIDDLEAEKLRDLIYNYIDQLQEAHDALMDGKKKKKKASLTMGKKILARFNDGVNIQYFASVTASEGEEVLLPVELDEPSPEQVKAFLDGQKLTKEASPHVTLVEDPFTHAITRILITSHVTHGRNMEDVYAHLNEKYKFTPREELSIQEMLEVKGFNLGKDLGRIGEEVKPFDGKQIDVSTVYFS